MNQNPTEKGRHEKFVAEKFCEHLGDRCQLLDIERESPDCLISIDGKKIGVELVRIRNSDAQDIAQGQHRRFQQWVCPQWIDDKEVNHWSISLVYRFYSGKVGRFGVPYSNQYPELLKELKRLVIGLSENSSRSLMEVGFSGDDSRLCRKTSSLADR